MSAALDEVLADVNALESDGAEKFEALARSIHAGTKPTAAELLEVLRLANKTKDDLASLVSLLESRDQYRCDKEEYFRLHERNNELRSLVEAANQRLETAVAEHRQETRPLQIELAANNERASKLPGWDKKLFDSCPCETLKGNLWMLQHKQGQVHNQWREANASLERAKSQIGGHNYTHFAAERNRIDAWVERAQEQVKNFAQQAAQLSEEIDAASQAMRDW